MTAQLSPVASDESAPGAPQTLDLAALLSPDHADLLSPAQAAARLGLGLESLRQLAAETEALLNHALPQARGRGRQYPPELIVLLEIALRRAAVNRSLTQAQALTQVFAEHGWIGSSPRAPELAYPAQLREIALQFGALEHQFGALIAEMREATASQGFQAQTLQERLDRFSTEMQRMRGGARDLAAASERTAQEAIQIRELSQRLQKQILGIGAVVDELRSRPALTYAHVLRAGIICGGVVIVLMMLIMSVVVCRLSAH